MSTFKRVLLILFIFIFFFLVCSEQSHAVSITISGGNSRIKNTDEYSVHITFSIRAPNDTQYYLRGAFAKQGTGRYPAKQGSNKYCGHTWNGTEWFNGPYTNEGWKHLLPITIKNNSWSGDLKAKLDTDNKDCKDPGIYVFKIERFKSSDRGTFDASSEQTITIDFPSPPVSTSRSKVDQPPEAAIKQIPTQNLIARQTEQMTTNSPTTDSSSLSDSSTTLISPSNQDPITAEVTAASEIPPSSLSTDQVATSGGSLIASVLGTASASSNPSTGSGQGVVAASMRPTQVQSIITKKKITKVQNMSEKIVPLFLSLGGVTLFITSGIGIFQLLKIKK